MESSKESITKMAVGLLLLTGGEFNGEISPATMLQGYFGFDEVLIDKIISEIVRLKNKGRRRK